VFLMEPLVSSRLPVHHIQIKKLAMEVVQMEYVPTPLEVLLHLILEPVNRCLPVPMLIVTQ
jgi:hypothetical protein